jgi:hypothetical protein
MQKASTLNAAKNAVTVVVRISQRMGEKQRKNLTVKLERDDGIVSAMFYHGQYDLLLVRYDTERYSSQGVLKTLRTLKVKAQLVGPI